MPNAALIERLFGSSSTLERTDLLIIDGSASDFSIGEEIKKLKAIQEHNPFPNLYLYKVRELEFNLSFKDYFAAGTFTVLGLEGISKGAMRKIVNSLPDSVTTIGIVGLSYKASQYFENTFLKRQQRKLTVIYGDSDADKESLEKVDDSSSIQASNSKKRKSSTQTLILASLAAHKADSAKFPRVEPNTDLITELKAEITTLKKTIGTMHKVIQGNPLLNNELDLQLKLEEAEEKIVNLNARIDQLSSENTWARDKIARLESTTISLRPELTVNPLAMGSVMPYLEDEKHISSPFFSYPGLLSSYPTSSDNPFHLVTVTPPTDEQLRNAREILLTGSCSSPTTQGDLPMSQQLDYRNPFSIFSSPPTAQTQLLSQFPVVPRPDEKTSFPELSYLRNL